MDSNSNTMTYFHGIIILVLCSLIAYYSRSFGYEAQVLDSPVFQVVGLLILSGLVIIWAWWDISSRTITKGVVIWIIIVGIGLRALMFFTNPILETDFYRYLWDGAVTFNGYNPYEYSPQEIIEGSPNAPDRLLELAGDSGKIIERVNHPHLRTIYPPVAQIGFALSYLIKPWSLNALRLIIFFFDCATLCLLAYILISLKRPLGAILIYWWNPLILKEFYNSAHMDIMVLPFVLGAIIFCARLLYARSATFLSLAMATKLWPAVLGPVILANFWQRLSICKIAMFLFISAAFMVIMAIPIVTAGLGKDSGFTAYSLHWEMNDGLYMLFLWGFKYLLSFFPEAGISGHSITRLFTIGIMVIWVGFLVRNGVSNEKDLWSYCLAVTGVLFMISPTQFPWYYTWVIPFLVVRPLISLLVLNALLHIYYLRPYFSATDRVWYFDNVVVWVEYIPVILILIWEFASGRLEREM